MELVSGISVRGFTSLDSAPPVSKAGADDECYLTRVRCYLRASASTYGYSKYKTRARNLSGYGSETLLQHRQPSPITARALR